MNREEDHKALTRLSRRELEVAVREFRAGGPSPCCVCEIPTNGVGVFLPNDSFARRIGQPPNKMRVVLYPACEDCIRKPDISSRVEAAILRDFQVQ